MSAENTELTGPDLKAEGIAAAELSDGEMTVGHVEGEQVLVVRTGESFAAIGATCSHYGGPLVEGVFDGRCVRCPWHHARFNVFTGAAEAPPALNAVTSYMVTEMDGRVYVTAEYNRTDGPGEPEGSSQKMVIFGSGAAGSAAAATLRGEGFGGSVTIVTFDSELPYDRPNLSKEYLAGDAPEEWLPLWPEEFFESNEINFALRFNVDRIDRESKTVVRDDGHSLPYDKLLIASGARPVPLEVPGNKLPHVHYLRSAEHSRAIIRGAEEAQRAVVVGASFIGLEVAASLRKRGLEVSVVAPEDIPMERTLGKHLGNWVKSEHERNGVRFHLGHTVAEIGQFAVTLDDGSELPADIVVIGIGVRPNTLAAEEAGLKVKNGIVVDPYLQTSDPDIWAAGDVAEWPDPLNGESVRVEHWAVAQRQGQTAARNMLGRKRKFTEVPFFWSQHYDTPIGVIGAASGWDEEVVDGDAGESDVMVRYRKDGKLVGAASIFRDQELLELEIELENR